MKLQKNILKALTLSLIILTVIILKEIVEKLTENGKYANEICLQLLLENKDRCFEYLEKYNITGKKLETFAYKCCHDSNTDFIMETIMCISMDIFDLKLVHKNLESDNPIPFIEQLQGNNEGYIACYKRYHSTFLNNMKNNKSR